MEQLMLDVLRKCKTIRQLHQVHGHAITSGAFSLRGSLLLPNILYTITLLASAAAASASTSSSSLMVGYALSVFNHIRNPTTFCYNSMMRAHTLLSSPLSALMLFLHMRRLSVIPDFHTYPFALKAAGRLRAISFASAIHSQVFKFGFISDLFVLNSIVHVYSLCGYLVDACRLFEGSAHKDVVSYNTLIDGFVKAGDTCRARELFDKMPMRDVVSWGTLVAGYAHMSKCKEAVELFNSMLLCPSGGSPDNIALVSALSACGQLGDLEQGKAIHDYIIKNSIKVDAFLSTSLVDFYAKCGCIQTAVDVFESSSDKNLFTWNAMMVGLAMHGHGRMCLDYFCRMIGNGFQPDGVSFLGILVGCSHAGLISEAQALFENMEVVFGVSRELKHYGCMADLLGRAGLIPKALEMLEGMPIRGDIYTWGSLLAGCRVHGLVDIAETAAKHVQDLNPEDGGAYSIMANVYANAELWDNVVNTRLMMKSKKVKKNAGCSLIKFNGVTHEFLAGDDLHPQTDEIYMILNGIGNHLTEVL
ncbi:hypothetical protein Nepgr_001165 [Nepenthes gracilis]|uniref:Pentatricopeptide repeat-containing protein n=1 Tax=Nepenthes gracilis TaxID=150966 RepID=A0AAD3P4C9_NEPGR|nr:hypothetical protein Nepgr_001165 [Nepenthes gracilis]